MGLLPFFSLAKAEGIGGRAAVSILTRGRFDCRSALGCRICEEFSFTGARGHIRHAACTKALAAMTEKVAAIVPPNFFCTAEKMA